MLSERSQRRPRSVHPRSDLVNESGVWDMIDHDLHRTRKEQLQHRLAPVVAAQAFTRPAPAPAPREWLRGRRIFDPISESLVVNGSTEFAYTLEPKLGF